MLVEKNRATQYPLPAPLVKKKRVNRARKKRIKTEQLNPETRQKGPPKTGSKPDGQLPAQTVSLPLSPL